MFGRVRTQIGEPVDLERMGAAQEERLHDFAESDILLPCDAIEIPVANQNEYRRWYQVAVANLTDEEYFVVTADNPRTDVKHELIPIEAEETIEFIVQLEPAPTRTETVHIEVTVIEYATDDVEGPRQVYYRKSYLLAPYFHPERLTLTPAKRLLQVRPWTRQVPLQFTLQNKNELAARDITLRLIPKDSRGQPIELEDDEAITIPIKGLLRPYQELKVDCVLPLRERPRSPIQMEVVAEYEVPRHLQSAHQGAYVSKLARPVQIAYLPYLRTWWPDWLIAGVWLLVLVTIFFGFPPVYKPELWVELEFEGYEQVSAASGAPQSVPAGVLDLESSRVLLLRYDDSGVSTEGTVWRPVVGAKVLSERRGERVQYSARLLVNPRQSGGFANREAWRLRGFLPFNDVGVVVKLQPELRGDAQFLSQYDLSAAKLRDLESGEAIDELRFSRGFLYGYRPHRVKLYIPYASGTLKVQLPEWASSVSQVEVFALNAAKGKKTESILVRCTNGQPILSVVTLQVASLLDNQARATLQVVALSEDGAYRTERQVVIERGAPPQTVPLPNPKLVGRFVLQVDSAPAGATVSVNGEVVGLTPLRREVPLPAGGNEVRIGLTKAGYREATISRAVQAGATLNLGRIRLTEMPENDTPPPPPPPPNRGGNPTSKETAPITVISNELGAEVLVNGAPKGKTSRLNPNLLYESESIKIPQDARIQLRKAGYRTLPPERQGNRYTIWMVPLSADFLQQASRHLNLNYALVNRINQNTSLAVRVSLEDYRLRITANKDCWVQAYFYFPSNQEVKPELSRGEQLAYSGNEPTNNFIRRGVPAEWSNVDWGAATYLYVIATTREVGETPDLREELFRNPSFADEGEWCIVVLKKPGVR